MTINDDKAKAMRLIEAGQRKWEDGDISGALKRVNQAIEIMERTGFQSQHAYQLRDMLAAALVIFAPVKRSKHGAN